MNQPNRFAHSNYLVRRKILKLLGAAVHVFDPAEQVVMYCELKAFKLREDIRIFTDESKTQELVSMRARQILDISATYDITDSATGQRIGALRRKGMKSILKDEWEILDLNDNPVGLIQEDSLGLALLRRFLLGNLLPQKFTASLGGEPMVHYKNNFNPFVSKVAVDLSPDRAGRFDRRIALSAGILLCLIEGKQG